MATAILDRLLYHFVSFNFKGESFFWFKEKKKAGVIPAKFTEQPIEMGENEPVLTSTLHIIKD